MEILTDTPLADQRTAEILESARRAFAEKGFDGASMQDIARKTGMSVGNFYRYFSSKAAIVEALIALDMDEMEQDFAAILINPDPMQALRETIERKITEAECGGDGKIWAEITAAALRKPEIGEIAYRMERGIVTHLITIFAQAAKVTVAEAESRWTAHAHLLVMMVKACGMQPVDNPTTADLTRLVLRNINRTLDDIATSAAAKG
ncbi:MAG: helix-turn-helix domain-containing protein [Pseudotabrizicola sp.]|uniref:TetR/AcrR family transcriptional regulator n=1 Tax=Pseudotabrizicola sp. TaxID=2939647 RepID=UPI00271E6A56|nr:TetR/AcrR family transcriptional regulator [Pseudotabrizicola sp.]MDO9639147.1 helix-turn-helix domain-containing protein [Pseudotabrizicola sp.]